jgi:glucose-6-phosphate 1-epimerase
MSLNRLVLTTAGGAQAEVFEHGGHATSWRTPDGVERLFLSARSSFGEGQAIRGGVPVIFPQFAGEGRLPKHGFARTRAWHPIPIDHARHKAHLRLEADDATLALWPHPFRTDLCLSLEDRSLAITLQVTNTGQAPFTFTGALHTYLRVTDIASTRVTGLQGQAYRDCAAGDDAGRRRTDERPALGFAGEVDRIYFDTGPITLSGGESALTVHAQGFPDVVVWNPGPDKARHLADLEPGGWRHFVCLEAAAIGVPITLDPGQQFVGAQTLTVGR